MTTQLKLDLRLWKPGQEARFIDSNEMIARYDQLKTDADFLRALMIDNLGMRLLVNATTVARCVFMFNGETSPDMMQLYEQHLLDLYRGAAVEIEFYEEQSIWHIEPDGNYKIIDTSHGYDEQTIEREGSLDRMEFISSAYEWIDSAIAVLERYANLSNNNIAEQAAWMKRLRDFSLKAISDLGWNAETVS
ncbi:MAG: hypothetical protein RMM17_08455 [Acidobacteriota bacterium]|nr:hypothetical protein [Blastocatellia bacterium]MDW8412698.1 hypothetical protein [Acidobacteriota bacterium]